MPQHLISIAPMMDCTDRHFRYFFRGITQYTLLYTEMITAQSLFYGDVKKLLHYAPLEHPIALQLGGSDPQQLAHAAKLGIDFGYDEINLNLGCPSSRVQAGRFGACLMKEKELVVRCLEAMQSAVSIPVTVKTRIGVDDQDSYEALTDFVAAIAKTGCQTFIIHARKAWLKGLSPKENREIPPLKYDIVYQLKKDFPNLEIIINGGIKFNSDIKEHLTKVDGVMIGRDAYSNPYTFATVDQEYFNNKEPIKTRKEILAHYLPYCAQELKNGTSFSLLTRPLLGLFHGQLGAKQWRSKISGVAISGCKDIQILERASVAL